MRVIRSPGHVLGGTVLLLLLTLLTVGCGANSSSTSATSSSTTTTTPCPSLRVQNQFRTTAGTIQSISGNTMLIADVRGNSTQATYTSSTRFLRESSMTVSSLKEGMPVTVAITQNADNTYSATRIMLVNRSNSQVPTRQRANANCFNRSQFNNPGGTQSGAMSSARTVIGTVGQLNGDTLIVADAQGSDYTVTVTSATQILQTTSASAADLKKGTIVTISGSPNGQGVINARTVTILSKLPTSPTR